MSTVIVTYNETSRKFNIGNDTTMKELEKTITRVFDLKAGSFFLKHKTNNIYFYNGIERFLAYHNQDKKEPFYVTPN